MGNGQFGIYAVEYPGSAFHDASAPMNASPGLTNGGDYNSTSNCGSGGYQPNKLSHSDIGYDKDYYLVSQRRSPLVGGNNYDDYIYQQGGFYSRRMGAGGCCSTKDSIIFSRIPESWLRLLPRKFMAPPACAARFVGENGLVNGPASDLYKWVVERVCSGHPGVIEGFPDYSAANGSGEQGANGEGTDGSAVNDNRGRGRQNRKLLFGVPVLPPVMEETKGDLEEYLREQRENAQKQANANMDRKGKGETDGGKGGVKPGHKVLANVDGKGGQSRDNVQDSSKPATASNSSVSLSGHAPSTRNLFVFPGSNGLSEINRSASPKDHSPSSLAFRSNQSLKPSSTTNFKDGGQASSMEPHKQPVADKDKNARTDISVPLRNPGGQTYGQPNSGSPGGYGQVNSSSPRGYQPSLSSSGDYGSSSYGFPRNYEPRYGNGAGGQPYSGVSGVPYPSYGRRYSRDPGYSGSPDSYRRPYSSYGGHGSGYAGYPDRRPYSSSGVYGPEPGYLGSPVGYRRPYSSSGGYGSGYLKSPGGYGQPYSISSGGYRPGYSGSPLLSSGAAERNGQQYPRPGGQSNMYPSNDSGRSAIDKNVQDAQMGPHKKPASDDQTQTDFDPSFGPLNLSAGGNRPNQTASGTVNPNEVAKFPTNQLSSGSTTNPSQSGNTGNTHPKNTNFEDQPPSLEKYGKKTKPLGGRNSLPDAFSQTSPKNSNAPLPPSSNAPLPPSSNAPLPPSSNAPLPPSSNAPLPPSSNATLPPNTGMQQVTKPEATTQTTPRSSKDLPQRPVIPATPSGGSNDKGPTQPRNNPAQTETTPSNAPPSASKNNENPENKRDSKGSDNWEDPDYHWKGRKSEYRRSSDKGGKPEQHPIPDSRKYQNAKAGKQASDPPRSSQTPPPVPPRQNVRPPPPQTTPKPTQNLQPTSSPNDSHQSKTNSDQPSDLEHSSKNNNSRQHLPETHYEPLPNTYSRAFKPWAHNDKKQPIQRTKSMPLQNRTQAQDPAGEPPPLTPAVPEDSSQQGEQLPKRRDTA